ncbi:cell cycle checkpoint protein RAD17-like [Periplaneta americana]|uniref:cell cycle checkpoint protein RAD17-like n=1 Tax=Periplaneta americana TaxID=6978 RepID=UPI0037E821BA
MKSSWISACFNSENSSGVQGEFEVQNAESRKNNAGNANSTPTTASISEKDWLKEYSPKNPSELVLQKPKLDQLNEWILGCKRNIGQAPILLITGPPGAGKSAAVKVLAAAQNIELIEWETPMDIDVSELDDTRYITKSQAMKFEMFLMNSGRYISVLGAGKGTMKLILVKELPHIFSMHPSKFEDVIRKYRVDGRTPIVFSFPEQEGSGSLFSKQLLEEMNVKQISFNKVPSKSVMKALKNICSLNEVHKVPSMDTLEKIVGSVNGDLRSAILQLYYEFVQSRNQNCEQNDRQASLKYKTSKSSSKSRKVSNKRGKEPSVLETGVKDIQLPIFQRVGRLLYPKKSEEDAVSLSHNPEEIVEQTLSHPRRFFDMVIENYLKVFRDMNDTCHAICYASDADTMTSEFRERDLTLPMALSTLTRGFMTCKSSASRKWTPLTNQEHFAVREKIHLMREQVKLKGPKYITTPRDASMDILPIMEVRLYSASIESKKMHNKIPSEISTKGMGVEDDKDITEECYEIQDSEDEDEILGEWIDLSSF